MCLWSFFMFPCHQRIAKHLCILKTQPWTCVVLCQYQYFLIASFRRGVAYRFIPSLPPHVGVGARLKACLRLMPTRSWGRFRLLHRHPKHTYGIRNSRSKPQLVQSLQDGGSTLTVRVDAGPPCQSSHSARNVRTKFPRDMNHKYNHAEAGMCIISWRSESEQ